MCSCCAAELRELNESLAETQPAGALVGRCRTLDQARAVVTFLDAAFEKTLRSTVALTAARGRGKVRQAGSLIYKHEDGWDINHMLEAQCVLLLGLLTVSC